MESLIFDFNHALSCAEVAEHWESAIHELHREGQFEKVAALAAEVDWVIKNSDESPALRYWRLAAASLRSFVVEFRENLADKDRVNQPYNLSEIQDILKEMDQTVEEIDDRNLQALFRAAYDTASSHCNKALLISALFALPLPTMYSLRGGDWWERRGLTKPKGPEKPKPRMPVLRLAAELNGKPISGIEVIQPNVRHALRFKILGTVWPGDAQRLRLNLVSTSPPAVLQSSTFETALDFPEGMFETIVAGDFQVNWDQVETDLDLMIAVRAAFALDDGWMQWVPLFGQDQLRFRVTSLAGCACEAAPSRSELPPYLPPAQFWELRDLLAKAYSVQKFRQMLGTKLGTPLDQVLGNCASKGIVYDAIRWAERNGRVEQLLREASAFVPENRELQNFLHEWDRLHSAEWP